MSSGASPAGGRQIEVTLVLRPPAAARNIAEQLLSGAYDPAQTQAADIAADPADIKAATDFAVQNNLQVMKVDPAGRTIKVSGTAADLHTAFGTVPSAEHGSVESLDYKGPINLPPGLRDSVIAVLGLDQTPIARPHTDQ
jgi:kumamolisin